LKALICIFLATFGNTEYQNYYTGETRLMMQLHYQKAVKHPFFLKHGA
jgi:hypothetical protein